MHRPRRLRLAGGAGAAALVLLLGQPPAPLAGQSAAPASPESLPRPSLTAVRRNGPITLDGRLDEAAWAAAAPAHDFVQAFPETGRLATQATEVRVLYDDGQLYIGAMLWETQPDGMIRKGLRRDFASTEDDIFGVALDTFLDRRNAFYFFINPNGAIRDSQAFDNSRISGTEWDGVMEVRTAVVEGGWSVEVAVPFATLRFDPAEEQSWGINFLRRVRRRNEDSHWAPLDRRSQIHRMELGGTLVGLRGIAPGRNLTVKPYLKVEDAAGSIEATAGRPLDGGLDLKYGVTPRLTVDATWRTDFSQVEVDQAQVNLTRFPLFFPEKRGFFIENTGTFAFGDITERNVRLGASPRDFTLFHSRRIGLEGGRPVPIEGGARVTGRAGGMEVGGMAMWTASSGDLPRRASRSRGCGATCSAPWTWAGWCSTASPPRATATTGAGGWTRTRGCWAACSCTPTSRRATSPDSRAIRGRDGSRPPGGTPSGTRPGSSGTWATASIRGSGTCAAPASGSTTRPWGPIPRVGACGVSELYPYGEAEYFVDLAGALETRAVTAGVDVDFLDAAVLSLAWTDRFERLDESFGALGATIPVGRYDFGEWSASYASNASRPLSGRVGLSGGGYYRGTRRTVGAAALWKPSRHVTFELSAERNRLELDGTAYRGGVVGGRLAYDHSTTLFGTALVQYDQQAGEVVSNVRLNWVHAPLSDLFLVYTERRETSGGPALDRRVTLKVTKLFPL